LTPVFGQIVGGSKMFFLSNFRAVTHAVTAFLAFGLGALFLIAERSLGAVPGHQTQKRPAPAGRFALYIPFEILDPHR
jgi:hypothetical protein